MFYGSITTDNESEQAWFVCGASLYYCIILTEFIGFVFFSFSDYRLVDNIFTWTMTIAI